MSFLPIAQRIASTSRVPMEKWLCSKIVRTAAKALRAGPDDRLYAFEATGSESSPWDPAGDVKVLARNVETAGIAVTAKGTLYLHESVHQDHQLHRCRRPKLANVYDQGEIASPAALALSPDQAMLIVTDAQGRFSWSFQIMADGSLNEWRAVLSAGDARKGLDERRRRA